MTQVVREVKVMVKRALVQMPLIFIEQLGPRW